MRKRQTFTVSDDLVRDLAEFRWRNRISSLSRALELIVRRGLQTSSQAQVQADDAAEGERNANNRTYLKMKAELAAKQEGSFAVIALGELQGNAPTLEEAYALVRARAPRAKHAIIKKIGERLEAEAVWEAVGERIR